MISVKGGVSLKKLQPQMAIAFTVIAGCFAEVGQPCRLTSGDDGQHMKTSLHYKGLAIDIGIIGLYDGGQQITAKIKERLGAQFDVVLESNHIHVEFDPK